jgi:hypothetical protein
MDTDKANTPTGQALEAAATYHGFPSADDTTLEGLRDLYLVQQLLSDAINYHVRVLMHPANDRELSWADIGNALGVSRQAAQQRYGR